MISRLAGGACALLSLLSVLIVWRLADSPDSDVVVGLVVAAPFLSIAVALGALAVWTRR